LRSFCLLLAVFPSAVAIAEQEPKSVPDILGGTEPSAIRPVNASERWFDGVTIGFGGSYEQLTARAGRRFNVPNLGVVFTYSERIRGPWSGGVGVWLSGWDSRPQAVEYFGTEGPFYERLAPLRVMSHVEWAPLRLRDQAPTGEGGFRSTFLPYAFAGVGYLTFFRSRDWPPARAEGVSGEAAVRYGVGSRFVIPRATAFNLTIERWRGVRTFDFSGHAVTLAAEFGDVLGR
jgi:hypothetical protein